MPIVFDQIGNEISLPKPPQRIISVVPSQTELLYDLGLEKEVVGITKFCVRPTEWFRTKERIGGTKTLNLQKIRSLKPDFIIANKEENTKEQIHQLQEEFPVWVSDIKSLEDALSMIESIGFCTGKEKESIDLAKAIKKEFSSLSENIPMKAAYFIWQNPYMVAGGDTFINEMMDLAGFENIFRKEERYPTIELDDLKRLKPDCLLLSSEPFPFKQKHVTFLKTHFPKIPIKIVDGELFSWYGSRLLHAPDYFRKLKNDIFEFT